MAQIILGDNRLKLLVAAVSFLLQIQQSSAQIKAGQIPAGYQLNVLSNVNCCYSLGANSINAYQQSFSIDCDVSNELGLWYSSVVNSQGQAFVDAKLISLDTNVQLAYYTDINSAFKIGFGAQYNDLIPDPQNSLLEWSDTVTVYAFDATLSYYILSSPYLQVRKRMPNGAWLYAWLHFSKTTCNSGPTQGTGVQIDSISSMPQYFTTLVNPINCATSFTFPNSTTSILKQDTLLKQNFIAASDGCDSLVNTLVKVGPSSTVTVLDTICQFEIYTLPNGANINAANAGLKLDTIQFLASTGCDSTVYSKVFVKALPVTSLNSTGCAGNAITFIDGTIDTLRANMPLVHTNILPRIGKCDSIVNQQVIAQGPYNIVDAKQVCRGYVYTFPNGTQSPPMYADTMQVSTFTTSANCDSVITTTLTVRSIDSSLARSGNTLYASTTNTIFQWYDCNSQSIIANETQATFTPSVGGTYAVIISDGICIDTSRCLQTWLLSTNVYGDANIFTLHPNPASNEVYVEMPLQSTEQQIVITDLLGKALITHSTKSSCTINLSQLPSGLYQVRVGGAAKKLQIVAP
ncbi:MAG: hypothetical protein RL660_1956 [Bacteroidota bacterium]